MGFLFIVCPAAHIVKLGEGLFRRLPCLGNYALSFTAGFFISLFKPYGEFRTQKRRFFGALFGFAQLYRGLGSVPLQHQSGLLKLFYGRLEACVLHTNTGLGIFDYLISETEPF